MENQFWDNDDIYICTNCNNKNSIKFKYCPKCGSIKPETIDTRWKCSCGVMNNEDSNYCYVCGKEKIDDNVDINLKNDYKINFIKKSEEQDENKYTIKLVKDNEKSNDEIDEGPKGNGQNSNGETGNAEPGNGQNDNNRLSCHPHAQALPPYWEVLHTCPIR